jgi:cytosine/adenosine deaminase-related metal-dependent hydrolase
LADGIGPARALADAGIPLSIGSDQHVVVDPFDEMRQLEGHERLVSGRRGRFHPAALMAMGTATGYTALGWNGGRIAVGAVADIVVIDDASPRTAGAAEPHSWVTASASDVLHTVVGGVVVVRDGRHRIGDIGGALATAIRDVWS